MLPAGTAHLLRSHTCRRLTRPPVHQHDARLMRPPDHQQRWHRVAWQHGSKAHRRMIRGSVPSVCDNARCLPNRLLLRGLLPVRACVCVCACASVCTCVMRSPTADAIKTTFTACAGVCWLVVAVSVAMMVVHVKAVLPDDTQQATSTRMTPCRTACVASHAWVPAALLHARSLANACYQFCIPFGPKEMS